MFLIAVDVSNGPICSRHALFKNFSKAAKRTSTEASAAACVLEGCSTLTMLVSL